MAFCTAVNCMDGRTQQPVSDYLRRRFAAECVDTVTEPGPDGILAAGTDRATIDSIFRRVGISLERHGSRSIAIVSHHDCAGHPVDKQSHVRDVLLAASRLAERFAPAEVIALWVDEDWQVHELPRE